MTEHSEHKRLRVVIAFSLVYIFWGSTYLGIRIGIEHLPPLVMTGTRFTIAGVLMLAYCATNGREIRISLPQAVRLAVIGILLLTMGNTILAWAELSVPTGLAALIVAVTPLWMLILETWVFRSTDRVSPAGILGLVLGFAGITVLLWPQLMNTSSIGRRELLGSLSLLGGSFCWSVGSSVSKRWQKGIDPFSASAWQMAFAGTINLLLALLLGDYAHATWTTRGVAAIAYLIIFGSWVGFSAFIWLIQNVPMSKVATYAYVNPVVAVFLGWLVLHEHIDGYILAGSAIIVVAVSLVTRAEIKSQRGTVEHQPLPLGETCD
ncbi:MAG TPA: EamA family transporter [Terriglobales bacterium]|nr:EamA family transporter [Terriglobales bacterium]